MAWNQDFGAGANPGTNNTAWRENFNGGWAGGDWTGNHNTQIAAEKIASGQGFDKDEVKQAPDFLKPVLAMAGGQRPGPTQGVQGGNGAPVTVPVEVVKSVIRSNMGGTITGMPNIGLDWGDIGNKLRDLWAGGSATAEKHEQAIIGGHKIVHDLGWSPMEIIEDIYGDAELLTPTWFYAWGKQLADLQKTAEANNMPGPKDILDAPDQFFGPFNQAGLDTRHHLNNAWTQAEGGWNTVVNWTKENITDRVYTPAPAAYSVPYSPWNGAYSP